MLHDLELGYITTLDYVKELEEERGEKKSEVVVSTNSKEVEELKERLKYVWERYEMAKKSILFVIDSFSKGDVKKVEEMKKKVGYKDDEREAVERQWASEN